MSHNRIYFIIIIFSCTHTVELLTIFQQPRGWIFYGIFKFCVHFVFQGFYLALLLYGFTLSLCCLTILFYLFIFIHFSPQPASGDFISLKVCAVGWEPNPHLTRYLEKLEQSYRKCGYRVIIHKVTLNIIFNTFPCQFWIDHIINWFWMQETGVGISNTKLMFGSLKKVTTTFW